MSRQLLFTCLLLALQIVRECRAANDWAVCLDATEASDVELFARQNKLRNLGEVVPESNCFHFTNKRRGRRSTRHLDKKLKKNPLVNWAEEQKPLVRVKRGPLSSRFVTRIVSRADRYLNYFHSSGVTLRNPS